MVADNNQLSVNTTRTPILCSTDDTLTASLYYTTICDIAQIFHLHKTLGLACLVSFAWRITRVGEDDMAFRSHPEWTIPTLLLHLALSVSSFQFKLPLVRIKDGSRIWPEYRLHSIIFCTRSLLAMALYWWEDAVVRGGRDEEERHYYTFNAVLVLLTMMCADLATAQQKHSSKSIRGLDSARWTSYFFSAAQFYATAGVLMGVRRYTVQFLNIFVVQVNPLLMTLRRKNLLSHYGVVTIYGFLLVSGLVVTISEYTRVGGVSCLRTVAFCGNLAILWRASHWPLLLRIPKSVHGWVQNKYLMWSLLAVLVHTQLRPWMARPMTETRSMIHSFSFFLVLLNGYFKCTCTTTATKGSDEIKRL